MAEWKVGLPLTKQIESIPAHKPSWVKISQIRTLATERQGERIGAMNSEGLDWISERLFELVG
ncbi:MAG: type II toxin-antitoxin system PemK/MazF family toxin [Candidatus Methylomirabilales bacterium]